jgi:hypothetical protein
MKWVSAIDRCDTALRILRRLAEELRRSTRSLGQGEQPLHEIGRQGRRFPEATSLEHRAKGNARVVGDGGDFTLAEQREPAKLQRSILALDEHAIGEDPVDMVVRS